MKQDKEYRIECLARAIKEVEEAKSETPELYKAALKSLAVEAKQISSIADLKKLANKEVDEKLLAKELASEPDESEEDDSE